MHFLKVGNEATILEFQLNFNIEIKTHFLTTVDLGMFIVIFLKPFWEHLDYKL